MTGRVTTPPPACVCGHVKEHHGSQPLQQMVRKPHCQWRGCGCPFYLSPADASSVGYVEETPSA